MLTLLSLIFEFIFAAQQEWRTSMDGPVEPCVPTKVTSSYEFWKHTDFTQNRLTKLL